MLSDRKITIGIAFAGVLAAGIIWFTYGHTPGYGHLSPQDLRLIRYAVRKQTSEPILRIICDGRGIVRVITGHKGSGLSGGGIEYHLIETSSGWKIVGHTGWMSAAPIGRRACAARRTLFAFSYAYSSHVVPQTGPSAGVS